MLLKLVIESDPIHTITYGKVSNEVARLFNGSRPYSITLRWPLGRMQKACKECDLPPLPTLVVSQNQLPGRGYKTAYDEFYGHGRNNEHKDKSVNEIYEEEFRKIQRINNLQEWTSLIKHYRLKDAFSEYMQ